MDVQTIYEDIIYYAISKEQEAIDLYRKMARRARNSSVKTLFRELTEMERNHKKELEKMDRTYFASQPMRHPKDLGIVDDLPELEIEPDSDSQDILVFAAKREKAAQDLYRNLARLYQTIPEIKKVFDGLAQEEASHKHRLECEYERRLKSTGSKDGRRKA